MDRRWVPIYYGDQRLDVNMGNSRICILYWADACHWYFECEKKQKYR